MTEVKGKSSEEYESIYNNNDYVIDCNGDEKNQTDITQIHVDLQQRQITKTHYSILFSTRNYRTN